jgi:hypothetical protein
MPAAVAVTPASPTAKVDACRIDITGASTNRVDHTEFRYYIAMVKSAVEYGRSYVFNVSYDGKHQLFTYIFPSAGTWDVLLCDAANDSQIAAASGVTVG